MYPTLPQFDANGTGTGTGTGILNFFQKSAVNVFFQCKQLKAFIKH